MVNKERLVELAERCEMATGGCYDLDARIGIAMFIEREDREIPGLYGCVYPKYSTSLDAAMTLVPEGWGCCIEQERPTRDCEASLSPPGSEPWGPGSIDATGNTLALALCAAALKARAAQQEAKRPDGGES